MIHGGLLNQLLFGALLYGVSTACLFFKLQIRCGNVHNLDPVFVWTGARRVELRFMNYKLFNRPRRLASVVAARRCPEDDGRRANALHGVAAVKQLVATD